MFLAFDQGAAQTLPFSAATHQAQRPRGRRITPEARHRILLSARVLRSSFSSAPRISPNSPIFDQIRLRARAGSAFEFATLLTPLPFSIDPVWLSRTGFRWGDQHLHSHRQCSGLRSASYALPAARPSSSERKKIILSRARVPFGPVRCPTMSDAQHGRARFIHMPRTVF